MIAGAVHEQDAQAGIAPDEGGGISRRLGSRFAPPLRGDRHAPPSHGATAPADGPFRIRSTSLTVRRSRLDRVSVSLVAVPSRKSAASRGCARAPTRVRVVNFVLEGRRAVV